MEEFILSAFMVSWIVSFGAGCLVGRQSYRRHIAAEEARTHKWKERAYKMAWGITLSESDMNETRHVMGVPKDYRRTPGGLRTSCK
jgi:hypothetical protein